MVLIALLQAAIIVAFFAGLLYMLLADKGE